MVAPLEIGTNKQLFIDDYIIDHTLGVVRTLNQPAKYIGNPVMIPLLGGKGRPLRHRPTRWRRRRVSDVVPGIRRYGRPTDGRG